VESKIAVGDRCRFHCDREEWTDKFQQAKLALRELTLQGGAFTQRVIIEGSIYDAVYFESAPVSMETVGLLDPQRAKATLDIFLHHQEADGYFPYKVTSDGPGDRSIGFGWLATAALAIHRLAADRSWLEKVYRQTGDWMRWLSRYRDTDGTGLIECWSMGDCGFDFSPRFPNMKLHVPSLREPPSDGPTPYKAPDISGLAFLEQTSLAEIAAILGRAEEARDWQRRAVELRQRIRERLRDPASGLYFDRDRHGRWVNIKSDVLLRVLMCGVPEVDEGQRLFDDHILNPREFWTKCPLPSIAVDEPGFKNTPGNAWDGPVQGLTLLRAGRAFRNYGRRAELAELARRALPCYLADPGFPQQIDPLTGATNTPDSPEPYAPAACAIIELTAALCGIRPWRGKVEWNTWLPPGATETRFALNVGSNEYRLIGSTAGFTATRDGRKLFEGTRDCCLVTQP